MLATALALYLTHTTTPPSVLMIAVDDLRNEPGAFGGAAHTPHIDALAKDSLVLQRNYVQQVNKLLWIGQHSLFITKIPHCNSAGQACNQKLTTDKLNKK